MHHADGRDVACGRPAALVGAHIGRRVVGVDADLGDAKRAHCADEDVAAAIWGPSLPETWALRDWCSGLTGKAGVGALGALKWVHELRVIGSCMGEG